jgi:tetratricopeptide (TPR) repeat protein
MRNEKNNARSDRQAGNGFRGADIFDAAMKKYYDFLKVKKAESERNGGANSVKASLPEADAGAETVGAQGARDLEPATREMFDGCVGEFSRVIKEYERSAGEIKAEKHEDFCRNWGNVAYALAVIKRDWLFYKDAKKYFEEAIRKYDDIGGEKGDAVLRRMGNACSALAAIYMDEYSYEKAETFFNKARTEYAKIEEKSSDDYRNWGNVLFEMGRVKWVDYQSLKENKDPAYKGAVEKEAEALFPGVVWGREAVAGKAYADRLSVPMESGVVKKMDSLWREADSLFDEAIKTYSNEDCERNDVVLYNWGEICSLRGRMKRYKCLDIESRLELLRKADEYDGSVTEVVVDAEGKAAAETVEIKRNAVIARLEKEKADAINGTETDLREAAKNFEDAQKLCPEAEKTKGGRWLILGATYYRLFLTCSANGCGRTGEAIEFWNKAKKVFEESEARILEIFVDISVDVSFHLVRDTILFSLLNKRLKTEDADFFNKITANKEKTAGGAGGGDKEGDNDDYKRVYIRLMYIMSRLEVCDDSEDIVAKYTRRAVAEEMLFGNKKFWLSATGYFNDPEEGKVLLRYLYHERTDWERLKDELERKKSDYASFVGCFSFSHDSLNQFRLYGKENDKEGTGVSLIFNQTFFNDKLKHIRAATLKDFVYDERVCGNEKEWEEYKQLLGITGKNLRNTLYRCVYIDPETGRVETVGQKEKHLFYRKDESGKAAANADGLYADYSAFIQSIVEDVVNELDALKRDVKKLDPEIVVPLILRLRYLIKPVSFKEEQECRIVRIYRIGGGDVDKEVRLDPRSYPGGGLMMRVEYSNEVDQHVKEVYFGPKAGGFDMFEVYLKHRELDKDIVCKKSKNHLA